MADAYRNDELLEALFAAFQAAAQANELETENRILETELAEQREATTSNHMGLVLILWLVLAALVAGGVWMWGRMNRGTTVYADTTTGQTVVSRPAVR